MAHPQTRPASPSPVKPLKGAVPWVGGKRNLARIIVARIDAVPHTCYAEPFLGAGGVFLRRRKRPECEAINDFSAEVSGFFRVLQRHPETLLEELARSLTARAEFERLAKVPAETLTDIERAARFFYLQHCSYGGKAEGRVFAISPLRRARFDIHRLKDLVLAIHRRLSAVYIERLDFETFIRRWDRPSTLFYLDPPYWGCEGYYGRELFERADFERLARVLKTLKGRFILSLNDRPEVRQTFKGFRIETVETTYRMNGVKKVWEVLISGGR